MCVDETNHIMNLSMCVHAYKCDCIETDQIKYVCVYIRECVKDYFMSIDACPLT